MSHPSMQHLLSSKDHKHRSSLNRCSLNPNNKGIPLSETIRQDPTTTRATTGIKLQDHIAKMTARITANLTTPITDLDQDLDNDDTTTTKTENLVTTIKTDDDLDTTTEDTIEIATTTEIDATLAKMETPTTDRGDTTRTTTQTILNSSIDQHQDKEDHTNKKNTLPIRPGRISKMKNNKVLEMTVSRTFILQCNAHRSIPPFSIHRRTISATRPGWGIASITSFLQTRQQNQQLQRKNH